MKKKTKKILLITLISIFIIEMGISAFVLFSKENNKSTTNIHHKSKENITNISNENINKNDNNNNSIKVEDKKVTDENNNQKTNIKNDKTNNKSNDKQIINNTTNENKGKANINEKKATIDATKEYYCAYGYTLNNNKCEYSISDDALIKYTCNSGVIDGSKCIINTTIEIQYTDIAKEACINYYGSGYWNSCICNKSGGTVQSNGKCYKNATIKKDANIEYYCPDGFELNENKCNKHYETNALFKYTCPNGYTLNNNKCEK